MCTARTNKPRVLEPTFFTPGFTKLFLQWPHNAFLTERLVLVFTFLLLLCKNNLIRWLYYEWVAADQCQPPKAFLSPSISQKFPASHHLLRLCPYIIPLTPYTCLYHDRLYRWPAHAQLYLCANFLLLLAFLILSNITALACAPFDPRLYSWSPLLISCSWATCSVCCRYYFTF